MLSRSIVFDHSGGRRRPQCHLSPRAVEPDVPRNMPRGMPHRPVVLEAVEPVIKGIVDLAFDQTAADPQAARTVSQGAGVNATRNLMFFETVLPGLPCVRNDE